MQHQHVLRFSVAGARARPRCRKAVLPWKTHSMSRQELEFQCTPHLGKSASVLVQETVTSGSLEQVAPSESRVFGASAN